MLVHHLEMNVARYGCKDRIGRAIGFYEMNSLMGKVVRGCWCGFHGLNIESVSKEIEHHLCDKMGKEINLIVVNNTGIN